MGAEHRQRGDAPTGKCKLALWANNLAPHDRTIPRMTQKNQAGTWLAASYRNTHTQSVAGKRATKRDATRAPSAPTTSLTLEGDERICRTEHSCSSGRCLQARNGACIDIALHNGVCRIIRPASIKKHACELHASLESGSVVSESTRRTRAQSSVST